MPHTLTKASSALGIHLEGGRTIFAPGDTIVGCVFRGTHIVSTEAVVKITLSGRVKTKIIAAPSTRGVANVYRGRSTLIDEDSHVQTIFQGPLHIAQASTTEESERSWLFTIAIPMYADNVDASAEQGDVAPPTGHIPRPILPGTFAMNPAAFGAQDEGFIEYTIKAELQSTQQGSVETTNAALPITIRTASLEPPIVDFRLTRHRLYGWISSYQLLPEVGRAGPSLSQKTRTLFGSSKVPVYGGHMEVDVPSVIQLENPNPIPIQIRFVPDLKVLKGSRIDDIPQKIQLVMLSMELQDATEIRCDGAASPKAATSPTTMRISVWSCLAFGPGTPPLYIPCADEGPPTDVGQKVNLRIGYTGVMGKPFRQGKIHPCFAIRHLKYTHRVQYELRAQVAGEELKFKWENDLTILPSTDTWEDAVQSGTMGWAPPAGDRAANEDEPPPPPFQEAWIRPPHSGDAPPPPLER
ncbi:hypothetical protein ACHAQA_000394 [Verticillium albo-atrum]